METSLSLKLEHVFDIRIDFDKRWMFGPVAGGSTQGYTSVKTGLVEGPRLNGKVVDYSGADWANVRTDGVVELNAHYVLEADDGTRIYIRNLGYVHGPLREPGAAPDSPPTIPGYFRCTPYFKAPEGKYGWLNRTVIVGGGERKPGNETRPRGKGWGGSSSINGMIYIRGHARDYDQWRQMGLTGWSYADVLPYFKRAETLLRAAATPITAATGRSTSPRPPSKNPIYSGFIEAGVEAGYKHTDDFNGFQQEGFGPYQLTIKDGKRWSASAAYLHPILASGRT
jgi:hypothetical protein